MFQLSSRNPARRSVRTDKASEAAMPPRRRKPEGRLTRPLKKQMTFVQIYFAIKNLEEETIRPEDVAALSHSQIRTLDSLAERTIERCVALAQLQERDSSFEAPSDLPDVIFKNAAANLAEFREQQLTARRTSHATMPSILLFRSLQGVKLGTTAQAKEMWYLAEPFLREMLWRVELGTADATLDSLTNLMTDDEILECGYLTKSTFNEHQKRPMPSLTDPSEWLIEMMREKSLIVPVRIATWLLSNAQLLDQDALKSGLADFVDELDLKTNVGLQFVATQIVSGSPERVDTHANLFNRWIQKEGKDRAKALGAYTPLMREGGPSGWVNRALWENPVSRWVLGD